MPCSRVSDSFRWCLSAVPYIKLIKTNFVSLQFVCFSLSCYHVHHLANATKRLLFGLRRPKYMLALVCPCVTLFFFSFGFLAPVWPQKPDWLSILWTVNERKCLLEVCAAFIWTLIKVLLNCDWDRWLVWTHPQQQRTPLALLSCFKASCPTRFRSHPASSQPIYRLCHHRSPNMKNQIQIASSFQSDLSLQGDYLENAPMAWSWKVLLKNKQFYYKSKVAYRSWWSRYLWMQLKSEWQLA